MKIYYPIRIIDLGFQLDYVTPKKDTPFEEYDEDPAHNNLFGISNKTQRYQNGF